MDKIKLVVANRISKQIDSISEINNAISIIQDNYEDATLSFQLLVNSKKDGLVSISSNLLAEYGLDFSEIKNSILNEMQSQLSNKYSDLVYKFDNNIFEEEKEEKK